MEYQQTQLLAQLHPGAQQATLLLTHKHIITTPTQLWRRGVSSDVLKMRSHALRRLRKGAGWTRHRVPNGRGRRAALSRRTYVCLGVVDQAIFGYFEAEVAFHSAVSTMASSYDRHLEDISKPFCSPKILRHALLVRLCVWWYERVMLKDPRHVDLSPVFKSEVSEWG